MNDIIEALQMAVEWIEFQGIKDAESETLRACKSALKKAKALDKKLQEAQK